jgi:hypothetical protein
MSISNATEIDLLDYIFQAVALPWAAATELDIHLHTSNPDETGITTTGLPSYGSYAAVTVDRNSTDWDRTGSTISNAILIQFPTASSGSSTITHVSVSAQGSTQILFFGQLSSPLSVSSGIQPQFAAGALTITLD